MIASASQDGNIVRVYDENGHDIFNKEGQLMGFTATTVTVKDRVVYWTYDENGFTLFSKA